MNIFIYRLNLLFSVKKFCFHILSLFLWSFLFYLRITVLFLDKQHFFFFKELKKILCVKYLWNSFNEFHVYIKKKNYLNRAFSYGDSLNFWILAVNTAVRSTSSTSSTNGHSSLANFRIVPCTHFHHIKWTNFICSVWWLAVIAIVCGVSNCKNNEQG